MGGAVQEVETVKTSCSKAPDGPRPHSPSRHRALLANAGSLLATTGVTSLTGFVFWWIAARSLDPTAVGRATSVVSAMTLIGTAGMLGFGTMLIAELASPKSEVRGVVSAAFITSGAVAGTIALAAGLLFLSVGPWGHVQNGATLALFVVGAALTAIGFVFDQAVIGLMAGHAQLLRNIIFSFTKLGLVALTAGWLSARTGGGVLFAWVLGSLLSIIVLLPLVGRWRPPSFLVRPDWTALKRLGSVTASHTMLNFATQAPRLVLPILATTIVSARAGAAFFVAFMLAQFAYYFPTSLATVLFAIGAGDFDLLRQKLRLTVSISLAGGVLALVTIRLIGGPVLAMFGSTYRAVAADPLQVLALGYFPVVIKLHYVAIVRIRRRLVQGALVATGGAIAEIAGAAVGARSDGIRGLCIGFVLALCFEAIYMSPTIVNALRRPTGSVSAAA